MKDTAMVAQNDRVSIRLTDCNASDDALAADLPNTIHDILPAVISRQTLAAIRAAQSALDANPDFDAITISSDMECPALDAALEQADCWRTGSEDFLVQRHGGLYLRILHKHNRQAEMEFNVSADGGASLLRA